MSSPRDFLPVRPHLGRHAREQIPARLRPEVRAKLPPAFTATLEAVPVFEQVDRDSHPKGWGYELTRFVPLEDAEALGWAGEA